MTSTKGYDTSLQVGPESQHGVRDYFKTVQKAKCVVGQNGGTLSTGPELILNAWPPSYIVQVTDLLAKELFTAPCVQQPVVQVTGFSERIRLGSLAIAAKPCFSE